MCEICAATATFDPLRHTGIGLDGDPIFATVNEVADAPSSISTPYAISVGDTFRGTLSGSADPTDYVAVQLTAGQTYTITHTGVSGGGGTLSDPYLRVLSSAGSVLDFDDDDGPGLSSSLIYTAATTGTHYLQAGSYLSRGFGSYTLSITSSSTPPTPTPPTPTPTGPSGIGNLDQLATYLTDGYWEASSRSGRSFSTSSDNVITVNLSGLTADGRQLARWALEAWEMVADLEFRETFGFADITFDDNDSGAYATSRTFGGTISSSEINVSTNWIASSGTTIDSYSFQTYVHEIGHALGLGHQGDYNGSARYGRDQTFANDSWQVSVMSYFDQQDNTTTTASRAALLSTMAADIVAIQNLYGAPDSSSATGGDTTWGANSNLGGYLGSYFATLTGASNGRLYSGEDVAMTIYDQGGFDTFDTTFSNGGDRIDMRGSFFSDVGGLIGNIGIARGTIIERLISGQGADTVTGNDSSNRIFTNGGNDIITAGGGSDTVQGGQGNDSVDGGTGADSLTGQVGNDTLFGNSSTDILRGDEGNDSLTGGTGDDTLYGGDGNDRIFGNTALDRIFGGNGNDYISSGDGVDYVNGEAGNDTIYGRSGEDSLFGGSGNDSLIGSEGIDNMNGGENNDWIGGGSAWDLLYGNSGDDTIYGNFGSDFQSGGSGNDDLFGGTGDDTLNGGSGNDSIQGNQGVDRIEGGSGNDTLRGGTQRDTFVFAEGHDSDRIEAFEAASDVLLLSTDLTGGRSSAASIVSTYARVVGNDVVFDFGGGDVIRLIGISSTDGLADNIDMF